jgi:hypothetical protein
MTWHDMTRHGEFMATCWQQLFLPAKDTNTDAAEEVAKACCDTTTKEGIASGKVLH